MSAPDQRLPHRDAVTWHELMTADPAGAKAFYGAVLGWRFDAGEVGGRCFLHHGDAMIGAVMPVDETGMPPGRTVNYVVPDIDAGADAVRAAGGAEAQRAFGAMMTMQKIDVAAIDAARRGDN